MVFGQTMSTTINYNKTEKPGLMLLLPYKESVAEGAILENLKKTGYDPETKGKFFWKQNKVDGFYTFKNVNLNNNLVDLYFKVDQKTRRNEQSTIYLLVSKGDENFITDSDTGIYESAKKFLNGFTAETADYKLHLDVVAQENAVKDAEKKLEKLRDNEKDIEKKISQLQDDLKKNRENQVSQAANIEAEKKKLEELKARGSN
jgi:hypothetical protein